MATRNATASGKGPWTDAHRRRLSAVRAGGGVPRGFLHDAASAWAALGESGPVPDALSLEHERDRARRFGPSSWQERSGRCFTDEGWNPLVALWVARGGWDFVFDLVMPRPEQPWSNDVNTVGDPGAVWYAIRRYLHAATPDAFAQARRRVEPVMAAPVPEVRDEAEYPSEQAWLEAYEQARGIRRAQSHIAFAFDRETDWAHRLLRAFLEGGTPLEDLDVLAAATTDASLLLAVLEKWGGLGSVYFVFDIVESLGARAVPVLDAVRASRAPDRKRVADARAIAVALGGGATEAG